VAKCEVHCCWCLSICNLTRLICVTTTSSTVERVLAILFPNTITVVQPRLFATPRRQKAMSLRFRIDRVSASSRDRDVIQHDIYIIVDVCESGGQ
jgi:hypothetical protein